MRRFTALIVNTKLVSSTELIAKTGDSVLFSKKRWAELGVIFDDDRPEDTVISSADLGVVVVYRQDVQAYDLTIPAKLRPVQTIGRERRLDTNVGEAPKGVLIGYDLSVSSAGGDVHTSLTHDARATLAGGALYYSGNYNTRDGYSRGLTTWSRDFYDKGGRLQAGDVFTGRRNSLTRPVNLGGVHLGTDRGLSAKSMYPVPVIGGLADTRSTAEIIVNGGKGSKQIIEPGPFQYQNLYLPGGLSDVTVITRDDSGREVLTTRKFYSMPEMVKKGGLEWDIEVGKVRTGSIGNDYGTTAAVASASYGVTNNWTLSGGVQTTGDKTNVSLGSIVSMGNLGAVSVDLAKSDNGKAYAVAYERRRKNLTLGASHTQYSGDYWQLADERSTVPFKQKSATTASAGYGKDSWRADLAYSNIKTDKETQEQITGRFRIDTNSANSWSLLASKNFSTSETTLMLGWQHKFGPNVTGSSTVQFKPTRHATASLSGNHRIREVPVNWQVSSDGERYAASARAQFSKATVSADITNDSTRLGVDGGLWIGEGGVILTEKPYSSFVVAEVEGQKGAELSGTGKVAKTNKNGYAVLVNSPALIEQPVSVNSESIPFETQLEDNTISVVAPRGGGVKATFKLKSETMRTYQVYVDGEPLSGGILATTSAESAAVGEGGYLVLMSPAKDLEMTVSTSNGTCLVKLPELPKTAMDVVRLDCKASGL